MFDTLPPLNAVRAFVAAARQESFILAGAKLNVSAGAISRHVKTLEVFLGAALFERHSNGVKLTAAGHDFLANSEPHLVALSAATKPFLAQFQGATLVISTLPIFAEKWLNPRLPLFQKSHPNLRLQFDFHDGTGTDLPANTDAMIIYSDKEPENGRSTPLFGETLVPVCSPDFREKLSENPTAKDIQQLARLLDTYWSDDWLIWTQAMGLLPDQQPTEMRFALYNGVIQAAASGMGIAIGHSAMIRKELIDGTLIALDEFAIPSPAVYRLMQPRTASKALDLTHFHDWVVEQSTEYQESSR